MAISAAVAVGSAGDAVVDAVNQRARAVKAQLVAMPPVKVSWVSSPLSVQCE